MSNHRAPLSALFVLLLAASAASAADGPTPYPSAKDTAAWPGVGQIRTFPYMKDNRAWFWTQRVKDQGTVVLVGDSLIGGWKDAGKAFPGVAIANRGVGGDTSRGILFRFREDVVDLHPRAVVIAAGANDVTAGGKADDVITNLGTMLDMLRAQDPQVPVVLTTIPLMEVAGMPDQNPQRQELRRRITAFATGKERMVVVDLLTALATAEGGFDAANYNADHVHPNAAGYAKWAAVLAPALAGLGVK